MSENQVKKSLSCVASPHLTRLGERALHNNVLLASYYTASTQLLDSFHLVDFEYVPKEYNWEVDELAHIASGVKIREEFTHKLIMIVKKNHPSIYERGIILEVVNKDANVIGDWRIKTRDYLEDPNW